MARASGRVTDSVASLIWETFVWVLDNPAWSASIIVGVVLSVVFALPEPRDARRRPARHDDESMNGQA